MERLGHNGRLSGMLRTRGQFTVLFDRRARPKADLSRLRVILRQDVFAGMRRIPNRRSFVVRVHLPVLSLMAMDPIQCKQAFSRKTFFFI